jgi:lipopolysaccharide export system protein LptC
MLGIKQNITIILFVITCTVVIVVSFSFSSLGGKYRDLDQKKNIPQSMQESYFKTISYYVTEKNSDFFQLDASELTINNDNTKIHFFEPVGTAYTKNEKPVHYKAQRGTFWSKKQNLLLFGDVNLELENTVADGDELLYQMDIEKIDLKGNVRTSSYFPLEGDSVKINSDKSSFWPKKKYSQYHGQVNGHIKRKRAYEENIYFASQRLNLNLNTGKIDLNEDVIIKKQALRAEGIRGEIHLENYNKKLKYFVLYDDVKVNEKVMLDGKFYERKAFGEKLEGVQGEGKIILTGFPKVYQFNDVIKGNKIVLRENNEVVEVDDANTRFKLR